MEMMYEHPIQYPKFGKAEYEHYEKARLTGNDSYPYKTPEEWYHWAFTQKRKCSKCDQLKRLTEFNGNTSSSCGFGTDNIRLRRPECTICTKEAAKGKDQAVKLAKSLGMSHKAPEGTKCELCNTTKKLVFDHDHEKNIFRGWLCDPCNRSMGVLGDDANSLLKTVAYLSKGNTEALELIEKLKNIL
jgi:hypothetical protein